MAGLELILIAAASAACDPAAPIERAERAVQNLDLGGARAELDRAVGEFACGEAADPALLGRMWLAEGVLNSTLGDPEGARLSIAAAHRTAPGLDPAPFGEAIVQLWAETATVPGATASIETSPVLTRTEIAAIDGVVGPLPAKVPPGLHLVQVGERPGGMYFAGVSVAQDGVTVTVEPFKMEQAGQTRSVASLHLAAGLDSTLGSSLTTAVDGTPMKEPVVKLVVPIEFGFDDAYPTWWWRAYGLVGPVVGGELLYAGAGQPESTTTTFGAAVGAGAMLGDARLGGEIAAVIPGRLKLRAVGTLPLGRSGVIGEARAGVNVATGGRVEADVAVALAWRMGL